MVRMLLRNARALCRQRLPQHVRPFAVQAFPGYPLQEAVKLAKAYAVAPFDETIEIVIITGLDPRKPNQMVRGLVTLPHGTGKSPRIAVFAKGAKAEEAKAAGADLVGGAELAEQILAGTIDFSRCMATPDMMPVVGKVARVLGPRGLMPNPKMGTVTMKIAEAVATAKMGQFEFKCNKQGEIYAGCGKASFNKENLVENLIEFIGRVTESKPEGSKGTYIGRIFVSSSQGAGVRVDITKPPLNMRAGF